MYGYYVNKLVEETKRVCAKNYRTMRKHFQSTAEEFTGIAQDVL
jgi:hypothetical protein